jgi:hypothetical protein
MWAEQCKNSVMWKAIAHFASLPVKIEKETIKHFLWQPVLEHKVVSMDWQQSPFSVICDDFDVSSEHIINFIVAGIDSQNISLNV